ncbi:DUF58 domain-containing protein [Bogoriella caseilytica]|uniref:DUF58 domain-containing protein n=1 Tax=Bogoriella caseilytica TaxID=56055 RepID=UPI000F478603|nr:DUF58 domain-containing protein [Bogoriella caseilytica]
MALTRRGWAVLVSGLILLAAGLALGLPELSRAGLLLTVLPPLALTLTWLMRPQADIRRTVSQDTLSQGESAEVTVGLTITGFWPQPAREVIEDVPAALGERVRFAIAPIEPRGRARAGYTVTGRHRGEYALGPATVLLSDPLGLSRGRAIPEQARPAEPVKTGFTREPVDLGSPHACVLVLPAVVPLAQLPRGLSGGSGVRPIPDQAAAFEADDVTTRTYRHGDEIRRVHWPATARRGQLIVRQEERPTRRRAVLVFDDRPGRLSPEDLEWGLSALASAGMLLAGQGHLLHLVTGARLSAGEAGQALTADQLLRLLARLGPGPRASAGLATAVQRLDGDLVVAALGANEEDGAWPWRDLVAAETGILLGLPTVRRAPFPASRLRQASAHGWRAVAADHTDRVEDAWHAALRSKPGRASTLAGAGDVAGAGTVAAAGSAEVTEVPPPGETR